MRLWRLSSLRRARDFDGGYGLANSGRWNTTGRPVTYCSTVPSLTALEKRVHVTDTDLLPPQAMVEYAVPDDVPVHNVSFGQLPNDWALRETHTQTAWLDERTELILVVPSVIISIASAPDRNVLINHRHSDSTKITITAVTPFTFASVRGRVPREQLRGWDPASTVTESASTPDEAEWWHKNSQ